MITADPSTVDLLSLAADDLRAVGRIAHLTLNTDDERQTGMTVDAIELAPQEN